MVDLVAYFKRNSRGGGILYTIRYTSKRFVNYAVDCQERVEARMTYNRPMAQTHIWSSIAPAAKRPPVSNGPDPSIGILR